MENRLIKRLFQTFLHDPVKNPIIDGDSWSAVKKKIEKSFLLKLEHDVQTLDIIMITLKYS